MTQKNENASEQDNSAASPLKQIFRFLSSMRLGITLLLLLAVISIIATLRPMEIALENIYTSWWFIGIMAFTAFNLLLCTVERIRPLSRLAFHPKKVKPLDAIKKMPANTNVSLTAGIEDPLQMVCAVFKKNGLPCTVHDGPDGKVVFAERGRLGYLGSIVTHFSLIIILLGAMYGSLTGFYTNNGGIQGNTFYVPEGNFEVTINGVEEVLLEDPTIHPRTVSDLTIKRSGNVILEGKVDINAPLRFDGISLYQGSCLKVAHIAVKDPDTGAEQFFKQYEGDYTAIDDKTLAFNTLAVFLDFSMTPEGQPFSRSFAPNRPVLAYRFIEGNNELGWALLELNKPTIVEAPGGPLEITFAGYENGTVFQITRNLGRPYLLLGSILLVLGFYISFFFFPRRFWAAFDKDKHTLIIGGQGYRNRLGIERLMEKIAADIKNRGEV